MLRDPNLDPDSDSALGFILAAIAQWTPTVAGTAATAIAAGFFSFVGEAATTGADAAAMGQA